MLDAAPRYFPALMTCPVLASRLSPFGVFDCVHDIIQRDIYFNFRLDCCSNSHG